MNVRNFPLRLFTLIFVAYLSLTAMKVSLRYPTFIERCNGICADPSFDQPSEVLLKMKRCPVLFFGRTESFSFIQTHCDWSVHCIQIQFLIGLIASMQNVFFKCCNMGAAVQILIQTKIWHQSTKCFLHFVSLLRFINCDDIDLNRPWTSFSDSNK